MVKRIENKHPDHFTYWKPKRQAIIDSCEKQRLSQYDRIGARGIKMCLQWRQSEGGLTSFIQDIIEEIGERPSPEHGLVRINETKDFEPGNMAWITRKERAGFRAEVTA